MHHLYVESKKYNKLVSITKRSRLTDKDNKLVVTNGRAVNIGIRDSEAQIIRCKISYKDVLYNTGHAAKIL